MEEEKKITEPILEEDPTKNLSVAQKKKLKAKLKKEAEDKAKAEAGGDAAFETAQAETSAPAKKGKKGKKGGANPAAALAQAKMAQK